MTEKAARKKAGPEFGILPGVPRLQKGVADKNNGIAKKENERSKCKSGKAAALFQKQENPGRKQNPVRRFRVPERETAFCCNATAPDEYKCS